MSAPDLIPADLSSLECWWYLSFVDPSKSAPREEQVPGGGGFQGVAVVRGTDIADACRNAWRLGCNPGGEVAGVELDYAPPLKWVNRILTVADVDQWDAEDAAAEPNGAPE